STRLAGPATCRRERNAKRRLVLTWRRFDNALRQPRVPTALYLRGRYRPASGHQARTRLRRPRLKGNDEYSSPVSVSHIRTFSLHRPAKSLPSELKASLLTNSSCRHSSSPLSARNRERYA